MTMERTTADIAADLERIAKEVPGLPSTFSELRSLLALIQPIGGTEEYPYRGPDWDPKATGQAIDQQTLIGTPPQNQTSTQQVAGAAQYLQTSDTQLLRTAAKQMTYSDLAYGPATLLVDGDVIAGLNAGWSFTYNADGTLATATRSGAAGTATVTVSYSSPGFISTISVVRGGRTVTITPSYSGGRIQSYTRAVT